MDEIKPRDMPHNVNDCVITCMDHRFQQLIYQKLKNEHHLERYDRLAWAGSSKAVADGTLIPQIQASHRLHNIKKVWIWDHTDCGGFGGLAAFGNDEPKEIQAHFESQKKAAAAIHQVLPQLAVNTFVINLEGEAIKPDNA